MPRITKAMLEEENNRLRRENQDYVNQTRFLMEKIKFLREHSRVDYLNSYVIAHEREVQALAQALTTITSLLKKER